MRYAGLLHNDFVNGEGVSVSLFTQGCPIHCPGCHNPDSWDFNGGIEVDEDALIAQVLEALPRNGIKRNLSILGGEPLCAENADFVHTLMWWVKTKYPETKIYIWTGYTLPQLDNRDDAVINKILRMVDVLIAGPYRQHERDITQPLIGSRNQIVWRRGKDNCLTQKIN